MKRSILKPALQVFALLLALLFAANVGTATTAVMLTDEELIASSRVILIGDVQSVKAQWDADHQTINTYVKVNVSRLLKGQLQNQTIVFKQLGGRVGDEATVIFGAPEYRAGQQLLLFLDTRQDGTLRVAHLFQGKYDVVDAAGQLRVKRQVSRDDVNLLGVTQAPNITNDAPLARFTKKIKRVLRDRAGEVSALEAQQAATPIVEVPAEYVDDTGQGAGDVSAQYTFLGSYRWFEPDSNQPVTFRVNSSGAPTASGGVTEINQAFAAWTAVQTTALTLQNIGSTTAYGFRQDGVSALSFNDPLDQMSDPVGCSGTLAIGGVTSAGGGTRVIGSQTFSHIFEGDVVFNRNFSCFLGISANLAEVATHEIGHAIGFGHSADSNAIMYATAHGSGRGATLGTDDIAAVTFLYPGAKSTQRYSDVPLTHPYYTYIEKIAQRGITSGCTATTYCPDGLVTRDQMAVFIEKALGVTSPLTPASQRFIDVPPSQWAYAFIGDFSTRNITSGCTANSYCPGGQVTREQMAIFLERARGRTNPGFPSSQRFVDVPPSQWSYAFVDSFVANNSSRGILNVIKLGCNSDGLHFCPGQPLTRGEMAAWLVIAFGW